MTWTNGRRLATISATTGTEGHPALSFTYDSDGLRLTKTAGTEVHRYTWQGGKLIAEQYGDTELEFFYDESGTPYALLVRDAASVTPTEAWYYYVTNLQGDVMQILDASGNTVASYTYNAWGKILNLNNSTSANIGDLNPIRYRGYYYDAETGLYYVSSRYYDPEICRWINADDASYLGANGDYVSYNLFAYCLNNPVNRTDATGTVSWAGVGAGLLLIGAAVFTIATFGTGAPLAVAAAGIAFSNGVVTTAAAATETPMVIDLSISKQTPIHGTYGKYGTSVIIDFSKNEAYKYDHIGGGIGTCNGITYSVGFVNNYSKPEDYSRFFYDINVGNTVGGDLCFTPQDSLKKLKNTTNAECVTFSFPYGPSAGAGVDYYSQPVKLFAW